MLSLAFMSLASSSSNTFWTMLIWFYIYLPEFIFLIWKISFKLLLSCYCITMARIIFVHFKFSNNVLELLIQCLSKVSPPVSIILPFWPFPLNSFLTSLLIYLGSFSLNHIRAISTSPLSPTEYWTSVYYGHSYGAAFWWLYLEPGLPDCSILNQRLLLLFPILQRNNHLHCLQIYSQHLTPL